MAVADPEAWVKNVERLYRAYDADGVSAPLYRRCHYNSGQPRAVARTGPCPPERVV